MAGLLATIVIFTKLKYMNKNIILAGTSLLFSVSAIAQNEVADTVTTMKEQKLENVTVTARRATVRTLGGAINGQDILRDELFKAACCNLGESFVNNPSVDVNYSDATTGARQVKLLGLSGTYVQMLTENLPNFRGAALPYGLGYVPGSWMKSIQVSKGNSSVKNGYEAMTGQINVEYLKPEDEQGATINVYGSTMGKFEANADANLHIGGNKNLSTEVLADRGLRMFQNSDIKRLVLSGGSVLQTLKNFEAFDFVREVVFDGTVSPLPTALEILHALPNNRGWHRHSSADPEINPVLRFKNIAGMSHDILSHFADKGYTDVELIEGDFDESAVYVAEQTNNSDNSNALQTLLSGVENTGLTEQVLKGMIVEKKYESNEDIFNSPFEEGEKEALIEYRKYLSLNPKYSREGLFERLTADNFEVTLYGQGFAEMFKNANIKHLTVSLKGSPKRFDNIFYYTNGEILEVKINVGAYPNYELEGLFRAAIGIGAQFGTDLKKLIVTICKDEKTPFEQGEFENSWHYYGFRNDTFKYWDLLPSLGLANMSGKIEFDTNVILSPEGWDKIKKLGFVIDESKKYNGPVMEDFSL